MRKNVKLEPLLYRFRHLTSQQDDILSSLGCRICTGLNWPPPVFALFCLQLALWRNCDVGPKKGLLGPKPLRRRALLILLGLLGPKPKGAKGPIVYLRILVSYYYSNLCSRFLGGLGPLTCSKTLEHWHTYWKLRPLGPGRDWYTGVAHGLYRAPCITEGHILYILADMHMKLSTHM